MAQVTVYLDEDTAARMRAAAKAAGLSQSRWLARLIADRTRQEWPEKVRRLAGAWADLPVAEELRRGLGRDAKREPL